MSRHDRRRAVVITVLLVLSTVVAPVALVAPVGAQEGDGTASLAEENITQTRGDVARFTVELNNTSSAFVAVGSQDLDYHVVFRVEDGDEVDESGNVSVELNTYFARLNTRSAGLRLSPESEADGDSLSSITILAPEEPVDEALGVDSYPIEVGTTRLESSRLPDPQDNATLELTERSTGGIRTMTAPYVPALDFTTREEFLEQVEGNVTAFREGLSPTARIAKQDWLVVQVNASGIYGRVRTRADLTGVGPAGNRTGVMLSVVEQNPPDTRPAYRVDLEDRDNALLTDESNGTMYLVLTTLPDTYEVDTVYAATFEVNASSALLGPNASRQVVSTTFVVDPRRATFGGLADDSMRLAPGPNQTVVGEATLAPGSEVDVVLENGGEETPLLLTVPATVSDERTFEAEFDLSGVPNNTSFTATVRSQDATISDEVPGRVVGTTSPGTTTPTPMERPTETPSPTEAPATETAASTPSPTEAPATGTAVQTTAGGGPGLGVLPSLVAMLVVVLLATRRLR